MDVSRFYDNRLLTTVPHLYFPEPYKKFDYERTLEFQSFMHGTLYDILGKNLPPLVEAVEEDTTPRAKHLGFYGTPSEQITLA